MSGDALHPEAFIDIDIAVYVGQASAAAAHRIVDEIYSAIEPPRHGRDS
jgi:hypothetical protein